MMTGHLTIACEQPNSAARRDFEETIHVIPEISEPPPESNRQPPISRHGTLYTTGSVRSTRTPHRSIGARSSTFGGPTLCHHGSQRSTSSWQRSSRAPSTLVDSPLPTSYLSTSVPSAYIPSSSAGDVPFSYPSLTPLDFALETSKLGAEIATPSSLPKPAPTCRILHSDKQSQLEEVRS